MKDYTHILWALLLLFSISCGNTVIDLGLDSDDDDDDDDSDYVISISGNEITVQHLGLSPAANSGAGQAPALAYDLSLDEYFRRCVLANQSACTETDLAKLLGISRKALWERRQRMNLPRGD